MAWDDKRLRSMVPRSPSYPAWYQEGPRAEKECGMGGSINTALQKAPNPPGHARQGEGAGEGMIVTDKAKNSGGRGVKAGIEPTGNKPRGPRRLRLNPKRGLLGWAMAAAAKRACMREQTEVLNPYKTVECDPPISPTMPADQNKEEGAPVGFGLNATPDCQRPSPTRQRLRF